MNAEIIAVGTELLLGQIANTNARFLSEELNALGVSVYYHTVVGDNPDRLAAQLKLASSRSDLIFLTGGLGPTKDDLTKEIVGRHVGRPLEIDHDSLTRIERIYAARQVAMTENNKRQATVIKGSVIFPNEMGLAPGMAVEEGGRHYLLFPGPPRELNTMFHRYAHPFLKSLLPKQITLKSRVMRFCGLGESALEDRIQDLIDNQSNPTIAPLAKEGEVTLRLTCRAESDRQADEMLTSLINKIRARVGEYQYGWDEETLEEVLVHRLRKLGLTVAAAESCTGGLFSHALSRVSGASQVLQGGIVCYTNESKHRQLGVPLEILETYGAVSPRTAKLLADHVRQIFKADYGVSVTGVAGPARQEEKPVGLVYLGIASRDKVQVYDLHLTGKRQMIQERVTKLALFHLLKLLSK